MFLTTRSLISVKGPPPPASGYATLDPSRTGSAAILTGGNLSLITSQYGSSVSNIEKDSGKWYFEAKCVDASQKSTMFGIVPSSSYNKDTYPGSPGNGYCYLFYDGSSWINDIVTSYAPNPEFDEWVGCYVDLDDGLIGFISNGVDRGTIATGLPEGAYRVIFGNASSVASGVQTINFGATSFAFTPPAGFNAGWFSP